MSNVITAYLGPCPTATTEPRYQYDQGQVLMFAGVSLPAAYQVDFSNNPRTGDSITQIGTADEGVSIPDMYFLTGKPVYAFVVLTDGDGVTTEYRVEIPVIARPARTDEEPTPEEQSVIDQAIAALNAGVERAETAADSAEQIAADLGDFETAMEAVTEAKNAAQQSASDASTSAGNAAQSAQNAAQSASGAASSAEGAYASEEAAAQSAEDASSSASDAATSATNAAASEAAARAVEESIPEDYSELSADVSDLKSALTKFQETGDIRFDPAGFQVGGIDTSTGDIVPSETKRVVMTNISTAAYDMTITPDITHKMRIAYYTNNVYDSASSWKSNGGIAIDKGQQYRVVIADYPTETESTSVEEKVSGLSCTSIFSNLLSCVTSENETWR